MNLALLNLLPNNLNNNAMKKELSSAAVAILLLVNVHAQAPEGFVTGALTMADGSVLSGYIKDNLKKDASVIFTTSNGGSKKKYNGSALNAVTVNGVEYRCIMGDFFKVICAGKICFLQKTSNASGKITYNGSEAIFASGTEGKMGDYFTYTNNQLFHITTKTVDAFINGQLSTCAAAVEKAKSINGDIAMLSESVTIYNNENK